MKATAIFILIFSATAANCQFSIAPNTTVKMSSMDYIVLHSLSVINLGEFNQHTGTIKFTGSSDVIIASNKPLHVANVEIEKSIGNKLRLAQHLHINNTLKFGTGLVDMNGFNISLDKTGKLEGENEKGRLVGPEESSIHAVAELNGSHELNPGNLGVVVLSASKQGVVYVRRSHTMKKNENVRSIGRVYQIEMDNKTDISATLRFHYFDAELEQQDEQTLVLWKSSASGTWINEGFTRKSTTENWIEKSAGSFSRWTLSANTIQEKRTKRNDFLNAIGLNQKGGRIFIQNIFPVPVTGNLNIQTGNAALSKMGVVVYDMKGEEIMRRELPYTPASLSLGTLSAGSYSLHIYSGEWKYTAFFIKQ